MFCEAFVKYGSEWDYVGVYRGKNERDAAEKAAADNRVKLVGVKPEVGKGKIRIFTFKHLQEKHYSHK